MSTVIRIEGLWKEYRLGVISHYTLARDLQSWWARLRGRVDPNRQMASEHGEPVSGGKAQDRFWALRDINFDVRQGEVLGIIGANGAGKSTLLKILSRVTTPTRGQLKAKGRIASLLEVGTGFHPELSGLENIFLNGAILGMNKAEIRSKLEEIIDFAGVSKFIDTPVKRYSSGMYVRLAFAVAAHLDPEILIVDEVLAVGDAAFREKCLGKLRSIGESGRTVLFVSHNMKAIEQLTHRCVALRGGEVVFDGATADAVDEYTNRDAGLADGRRDVSEEPRVEWAGDGAVTISDIELTNPDAVHSGCDALRFRVGMAVRASVEECNVAVTLCGRDDSPVGSFFGPRIGPITAGSSHQHEFCISNPGLAPGRCSITIGLMRPNGRMIDLVERAIAFEIRNAEAVPGFATQWSSGWGALRLEGRRD